MKRDFRRFMDIALTNCHIHILNTRYIYKLEDLPECCGIKNANVLSAASYFEEAMADNCISLLFKLKNPRNAYAFAALHHPLPGSQTGAEDFGKQAERFMKLGFDGMKMMEGKPDFRKRLGIPLDSPVYDSYYDFVQAEGIPLLYHVADPAIFWDGERIPEIALKNNWGYLDGSFLSKEGLYNEIDGVLKKFPGLRIIFAHFYFMDDEGIKRASEFLDKWPGVSFDLAPGMLFINFSKDRGAWREFFTKYQDRIIFGTDRDGRNEELLYVMRTLLETDDEMEFEGYGLKGLKLDKGVLAKIYHDNFKRYVKPEPQKVDTGLIMEECRYISAMAQDSPKKDTILQDINDIQAFLTAINTR